MTRHRPTEVREVRALLEREWDDTDELTQAVLDKIQEVKWSRWPWIAIQRHRSGDHFTAWGPYATRSEAERDVGRRIIGAEPGDVAYFCRVVNKDVTEGADPGLWDDVT